MTEAGGAGAVSLVAGVGQPWMCDLAFGCHVVRWLGGRALPEGVEVRDLSFSPVAAFQLIRERSYRRAVFVTARSAGRARGGLYEGRLEGPAPSPEELQARIGESVMGCVSLDDLLAICRHFDALPPVVTVLEVEPEDDSWGPCLSAALEPLVERAALRALAVASAT